MSQERRVGGQPILDLDAAFLHGRGGDVADHVAEQRVEVDLLDLAAHQLGVEPRGLRNVGDQDDKGIEPAQNLTPAVNADFLADNPDLEELFNALSAALTTEDLAEMNVQVDLERKKPEDVAQQFLEGKGLL